MAISSHGATFTFSGIAGLNGNVTSISVEEAQPEVVDMTTVSDDIGIRRVIATGDVLSPPKVSIEYFRTGSNLAAAEPLSFTGSTGAMVIGHSSFSVAAKAMVESMSTEMAVGDVIKGRISFIIDKTL